MKNLREISFYHLRSSQGPKCLPNSLRVLEWHDYPSSTLPNSHLETLEKPFQNFYNLCKLDLRGSRKLKELPDISNAANLEDLNVSCCKKLTKIDDSVGHLAKLRVLDAHLCCRLDTFIVGGIKLVSLEMLNLSSCKKLHTFPKILVRMKKIKTLDLRCTAIETLPESIKKFVTLEALYLSTCRELPQLPNIKVFSIQDYRSLTSCYTRLLLTQNFYNLHELDIQRSENLEEVPDISKAVNLEVLNLSYCGKLTKIDDSVGHLTKLKVLDARGCDKLDTFIIGGIKLVSLEILNLSCCFKLHTFPEILVTIEKIKTLDLCCTAIKTLPQSIEKLVALEALYLRNCRDICQLPNLAFRNLKTLDLDGCVCLQEIRGNLSNIKVFSARDCTSLTSCFTSLLLTEELHETGNTNFILPGKEIPKWFHKHSIGSSLSFWVHKFPQIALCAVLTGSPFTEGSVSFVLRINDTLEYVFGNEILPQNETDYILLFDLRSHDMNFNMIRNYLEEELNHVEFSWEGPGVMESGYQFVKCFGIYFYNYDICMKDILFENPIPQKRIPVEGVHKICESNSESSSVYYDNSRDCRASNDEDDKSKNEIVALSTEVVSTIEKEEKKWMLDVVDSSSFSTSLGYSSDNSSTLEDQSTINDKGHDEMGSRKTRVTCFDLFSCLVSLCSSSTTR